MKIWVTGWQLKLLHRKISMHTPLREVPCSERSYSGILIQTHNQLNLNSLTMMTLYFDVLTSMNWPLIHITTTQRILEAFLTCHYVTLNIPSSLLVNWLPHSVLSWHQIQNLMLTYIGNVSLQNYISPSRHSSHQRSRGDQESWPGLSTLHEKKHHHHCHTRRQILNTTRIYSFI